MFVVIDVETANADMSSICQIGVAKFTEESFIDGWSSLVNPEDYFDDVNVSIHGISEDMVQDSRTFAEVASDIQELLNEKIVVSHTSFDRLAINRACSKYALDEPVCQWLDSTRVVRRTWLQFARRGYGLANVANHIQYEFEHHDALNDAKAAGHIMLAAVRESGVGVQEWLTKCKQPIGGPKGRSSKEGDKDGVYFGDCIVFTGALQMPRREAAELAAKAGFNVGPGVSKRTSILVVGDQDIEKLAGHDKSRKHRRAEELIKQGVSIRIVAESDFHRLLALDNS